jgi:hypothetical protein
VRDEGMKKLLAEISTERVKCRCVRRKIKMIKTVYSQELNKIMKSKKSGGEANDLYKPKLGVL